MARPASCAAKDEASIRHGGIKPTRVTDGLSGVYAISVLPSYFVSHQWLRELRRLGTTPLVAIDFVIPDSEDVYAGHYSQPPATMTAAEATGVIMHADDPRVPDAHGQAPCGCEVCQRGTFKAAQVRDRN